VVREGGLEISNVIDSDAGNYTCRAEVDEFGNYAEQFISVDVNSAYFTFLLYVVVACSELIHSYLLITL